MAKSELHQQFNLRLSTCTYPIYIGSHCLYDEELLRRHVVSSQVLIVSNETIAPLYLKHVQEAFKWLQCDVVILPDGEGYKNQQNLFKIFNALIEHQHHRDTTLIALGGGVIGDITGFAAATYQRGVSFIQLPTTLLAQVDASVGGKTAINHPLGKNMIGSFHQPDAVIMDVETLATLPLNILTAGMGEVVKYGLLAGGDFLQLLQHILDKDLASINRRDMADLIAGCCKIKAEFVEGDERELGKRALLNLGHTFAHALEAYTNYETWQHGEAVAIGLFCAALLSNQLGCLSDCNLNLVDGLLLKAKLPRRIPKSIELDRLQTLMFNDKKIKNNQLRFILMRAPGDCYIDHTVSSEMVWNTLVSAIEEDER